MEWLTRDQRESATRYRAILLKELSYLTQLRDLMLEDATRYEKSIAAVRKDIEKLDAEFPAIAQSGKDGSETDESKAHSSTNQSPETDTQA